ncbi:MAG: glucosamine-6-phosphate deaminase [Anaerolineae bacterium]|nr:glucosamine-6-phosphate deaminase [Anaerolineae bacterium]
MERHVFAEKHAMAIAAAEKTAALLTAAIDRSGGANLILATGASQFEMLDHLVGLDVDWASVTGFHLDEYLGLPESHPASFRGYLRRRFVERVPSLRAFHYVNGESLDPRSECARLGDLLRGRPVDVACIGIGENGHLAFNDPPADFDTDEPYIVVDLDEACRRQQLGEGWFPALSDVPLRAISMSIRQIMRSRAIVCTVPDARKSVAVQKALEGPVTNLVPSSILQQHPCCDMYLDADSAALLEGQTGRGQGRDGRS